MFKNHPPLIFHFQLDMDGDGKLSFEEFKVLFDNAEKRRIKAAEEAQAVITSTLFGLGSVCSSTIVCVSADMCK